VNDFEEMQRLYEESVPIASRKGRAPNNYNVNSIYRDVPPRSGIPINRNAIGSGFPQDKIPLTTPGSGAGGPAKAYNIVDIVAGDEELPEEKQMTNLEVIDKIGVIIKELDPDNILDRSALDALGKLKLTL
jgi:hypothetical protein